MAVYFGEDKVNLLGGITVSLNGTDTSDATATADDIASGATAYVNGKKLTGTLEETYPSSGTGTASYSTSTVDGTKVKLISIKGEVKSNVICRQGQEYVLFANASDFGTASASDVASGKTFTSINGLKITGTASTSGSTSSGLDTSDATATASDMAEGVTAYVNGEKITGTLPVNEQLTISNSAINYQDNVSGVTPFFCVANSTSEKAIYEKDTLVALNINRDNFGDATASDVVAGKTFTSANGLKIAGTRQESSGTTTSGGLAMKTGTTSEATFDTGLSSVKQFVLYKTAVAATGLVQATYNEGLGTSYVYCSSYSTWSKSYAIGTTAPTIDGGSVTWNGSSTQRLSSSTEYTWIAIGEE